MVGLGKAVRRRPLLREELRMRTQRGRDCPRSEPLPWRPSPKVRLSPRLATEKKGHCSLVPLSFPSETPPLFLRKGSRGRESWVGGGDKQVAPRLTLNPNNGKGAPPSTCNPSLGPEWCGRSSAVADPDGQQEVRGQEAGAIAHRPRGLAFNN